MNQNNHKRKRRRRIMIFAMLLIVAVWILGDFVYSKIVAQQVAAWESSIERDKDGVQIGAEAYSIHRGQTALLLVHGFNDTPQAFSRMAPELADRGFSVRAVRLPGFGVPVERMKSCTYRDWLDVVRSEAQQLHDQYQRVILVGHSLGGAVTIGFLVEHQKLVDGAVLLAPAVDVANNRSPLLPTRFWRRLGDFLLIFSDVYQSPFDRNDASDLAVRNPEYKSPFTTRNIVRQTMHLIDHNLPHATKIQIPVLMVLTRNDQVVDWAAAESYFERLTSRDKHLKFCDTSGHALTVDVDWTTIVDEIEVFANSIGDTFEP